ncbi:hypothetical protein [Streptomyces tateyamensis]|uniref:hypothetical protein n=1 Tax=Streptomyces tateyamensis TaxID=565073 RepID=UPI0015E8C255|nr:hypothetical protein [Streptomyces tateyamensis]
MLDDSPNVPVTRFVGQTIRSVRQIAYNDGHVGFTAGLTLQFPSGSIRLLGLVDDLLIAQDQRLGPVEAYLHEDVTLARVVRTSGACPSQWDAWTTTGQYLYLRYRHGEGTVEQHPSEDLDTWDGEASRLWTSWDDGTDGGWIELSDFLAMAGLRLAPDAEVRPPLDVKAWTPVSRGPLLPDEVQPQVIPDKDPVREPTVRSRAGEQPGSAPADPGRSQRPGPGRSGAAVRRGRRGGPSCRRRRRRQQRVGRRPAPSARLRRTRPAGRTGRGRGRGRRRS